MAFSASAVAFALGENLWFPVVFTGAQAPPNVYHGDARTNLYRAVLAAQTGIPEVTICFGDYLFRACRAQKKDDRRFDGFESPTYPPLAIMAEDLIVREELIRAIPHPGADIELRAAFASGVLEITQYPGLETEFFMSVLQPGLVEGLPRCKGIIIQTLGAGNVATRDPYSFLPFVRQAVSLGIPVLVTSQYPPDPESYKKYAPAAAPIKAGAIHAGNMTSAAAVAKFRWVLAQIEADSACEFTPSARVELVKRMMVEKDYVGELSLRKKGQTSGAE
jgi:L-asparaginase